MLLSLDWLKDYVDIPRSLKPRDLGLKLTMHTVEVDDIYNEADKYRGIIIGEIKKVLPHPNADKLKIALVNTGKEELRIVCGADNIAAGQKAPVALDGAVLPGGFKIKRSEIRGEASEGMLCAEDELCLGPDHSGIMILDSKAGTGSSLGEYLKLNDVIYEIDNKSITNRPDLWGHYGMAREIAAFLGVSFREIKKGGQDELSRVKHESGDILSGLKVKVENAGLCPRYTALPVKGIKIKESPSWMQKRLIAGGMRPINNIVDITNYVMLELGQPLHAFDASFIAGGSKKPAIIVRNARKGEMIATLDREKRELKEDMLVIADKEKAIAIAGIMGGEKSEVASGASSIIIESANFDFISIRKTSQALGLRTEASKRFEKSLDPNLCPAAAWRALELIKENCPEAELAGEMIDESEYKLDIDPIELDWNWLDAYIGQKIPRKRSIEILEKLGFSLNEGSGTCLVTAPSWRATKDISIKEDLAEEISRIVGYGNIKPKMPEMPLAVAAKREEKELIKILKNRLSGALALTEVYNYSFVGEEQLRKIGADHSSHLKIINPIVKYHSLCRQSLIPNLILNVKTNQARFDEIRLFEIGSVFFPIEGSMPKIDASGGKLPFQEKRAAVILAGYFEQDLIFELKGMIENLLSAFFVKPEFEAAENLPNWAHDEKSAFINVQGSKIGSLYIIKESAAKKSGVKKKLAAAEISLAELLKISGSRGKEKFKAFDRFPPATRDLAFVVNNRVLYGDIKSEISGFHDYISQADLFDVYEGDKLGRGKKSYAFHVVYRAGKTLTGEEVDDLQKKLFKRLEERFDAVLRDF